jgi:hypothetical protein
LDAIKGRKRIVLRGSSLEAPMPQVWLSFEEIQELFRCDAADARRRVVAREWERRRCSDGLVRAQVPPEVARDFFMSRRCDAPKVQPEAEPEAQPERASDFHAAMETLCRVFAADAEIFADTRYRGTDREANAGVRSAA